MSTLAPHTRVLVTRPVGKADAWRVALESAGADVISYPTIRVEPPESWALLDAAVARLETYDYVIFTSETAARFAGPRIFMGRTSPLPAVVAVGNQTAAALEALGIPVAIVPTDERQEGLIDVFASLAFAPRILFPRAIEGRDAIVHAVRSQGGVIDVVPASRTVPVDFLPPPPPCDAVVFASPSAVSAFVGAHGIAGLASVIVVCVGPTTAAAAVACGIRVVTSTSPAIDSVIAALARAQNSQGAP